MSKSIFVNLLFLIVFQACTQKGFIQKNRQVDLLPAFIPSESIRIIEPSFSCHQVLGVKNEWSFPLPMDTQIPVF
jgi:hypothetical protein